MMDENTKNIVRIALVSLAKSHKKTCKQHSCDIHLFSLYLVCNELNITLTKSQEEVFL